MSVVCTRYKPHGALHVRLCTAGPEKIFTPRFFGTAIVYQMLFLTVLESCPPQARICLAFLAQVLSFRFVRIFEKILTLIPKIRRKVLPSEAYRCHAPGLRIFCPDPGG